MPASKVGRNDPCPCGSGKKYKHCHMRQDQQYGAAAGGEQYDRTGPVPVAAQLQVLQRQAREALRTLPPGAAPKLQEALDATEELIAYNAALDRIEAAGTALEAHRKEFEGLLRDGEAAVQRARRLFGEGRFRPFRFSAYDVGRAFEAVGFPHRAGMSAEDNDRILVKAGLYLAGENDYRQRMARHLMLLLPEFVQARRYLDAWLLQYSAFLMLDRPKQSNPFLGMMFDFGFADWASQVDEQGREVLREMGLDPEEALRMSPDQALAHMQAQMEDPARKAHLERYYAEHPLLSEQGQAELTHLQRNALKLIERPDAQALRLATDEIMPWVPKLMERMAPLNDELRQAMERGGRPKEELQERASKVLVEVSTEMARAIFTRSRVNQLLDVLRDYCSTLVRAHDGEAAMLANAVLLTLKREETDWDDQFLVGLCYLGLREGLVLASEQAKDGDRSCQAGPPEDEADKGTST